jgi:hypothetical protein
MGTGKELTLRMLFEVCGLEASIEIDAKAGGRRSRSGLDVRHSWLIDVKTSIGIPEIFSGLICI